MNDIYSFLVKDIKKKEKNYLDLRYKNRNLREKRGYHDYKQNSTG